MCSRLFSLTAFFLSFSFLIPGQAFAETVSENSSHSKNTRLRLSFEEDASSNMISNTHPRGMEMEYMLGENVARASSPFGTQSLMFDGDAQGQTLGYVTNNRNRFTVSGWIYPSSTQSAVLFDQGTNRYHYHPGPLPLSEGGPLPADGLVLQPISEEENSGDSDEDMDMMAEESMGLGVYNPIGVPETDVLIAPYKSGGSFTLRLMPAQEGMMSLVLRMHHRNRTVTVTSRTPMIEASRWNHVGATFDGRTIVLYANGRMVARQNFRMPVVITHRGNKNNGVFRNGPSPAAPGEELIQLPRYNYGSFSGLFSIGASAHHNYVNPCVLPTSPEQGMPVACAFNEMGDGQQMEIAARADTTDATIVVANEEIQLEAQTEMAEANIDTTNGTLELDAATVIGNAAVEVNDEEIVMQGDAPMGELTIAEGVPAPMPEAGFNGAIDNVVLIPRAAKNRFFRTVYRNNMDKVQEAPVLLGDVEPEPEECTDEISTVCAFGEDGEPMNFDNRCLAEEAGATVIEENSCIGTRIRCSDVENPVCGTNLLGERGEFMNSCFALAAYAEELEAGQCQEEPPVCEEGDDPVCAYLEDGTPMTFANYCEAEAEGAMLLERMECRADLLVCTEEEAPVCGVDRVGLIQTYSNTCIAGIDYARVLHQGSCGAALDPCETGEPVCAFDSEGTPITFDNECEAERAGATILERDTCRDMRLGCTEEFDPVCAVNRVGVMQTYSNSCMAGIDYAMVEREGACEDVRLDTCSEEGDVCAHDENGVPMTFSSECEAEAAGAVLIERDICRAERIACPLVEEPVCAMTRVDELQTFTNSCFAGLFYARVESEEAC